MTVSLAPALPGLSDAEAPAILKEAKACGARAAFIAPVRLTGSLTPVFLERIREAFPDRADKVAHRLRGMQAGRDRHWETCLAQFRLWRRRLGLDEDHPMPPGNRFRRPGPRQGKFAFVA